MRRLWLVALTLLVCDSLVCATLARAQGAKDAAPLKVLPDTQPLAMTGDITSELVAGVDSFLLKQLAQAPIERQKSWPLLAHGVPNKSNPEKSNPDKSDPDNRDPARAHPLVAELSTLIGLRDQRIAQPQLQVLRNHHQASPYQAHAQWQADLARWPVLPGVDGEGLYVRPVDASKIRFQAIILPDAGQTPEDLIGVGPTHELFHPWAANLAASGGEVVVTTPISRHREARRGRAKMTDQEFIYRSAFELGRHMLGYQVHETLAAIESVRNKDLPLVVIGWGEGGWVALHTAAVSNQVAAVCVSGHFQARENIWQEPIHRNVHGLLTRFGDAELAAMIAPRAVVIDNTPGPTVTIDGEGGAPGKLSGPSAEATRAEIKRALEIPTGHPPHIVQASSQASNRQGATLAAVELTLKAVNVSAPTLSTGPPSGPIEAGRELVSPQTRRLGMLEKWDRFTQRVLEHADDERAEYWKELKTDSLDNFKTSVEPYREKFAKEVIGRWDLPLANPEPRTRLVYEKTEVGWI